MHLQNGCGEDQCKKENTSVVDLYVWSRTFNICWRVQVAGGGESCCGCHLRLSLMFGEADFDEAKGEVEAHWQIYLGGPEGQGEGYFEMQALQYYEHMGFKGFVLL